MSNTLLLASVTPDQPMQLLMAGVFQLASDPVATERGHLHLRMNYLTPQTKREGGHVKILARVWLPINDPVAVKASGLELRKGDYVYAVGWAELQYERAQSSGERSATVFAVITFRTLQYLDRLDAERVEAALAQQAEQIAQRISEAQARRNAKPQQPQTVASAEGAGKGQPTRATASTKPRGVTSPNWSDMPQGISLDDVQEEDMEDPFADMEELPQDAASSS